MLRNQQPLASTGPLRQMEHPAQEGARNLKSTLISRVSAAVLLIGGVVLLFAPDVILPMLMPDYPSDAAWLGQLVGAAWLGVSALNWLNRGTVLGGIYGRPVVLANLTLYFISTMVILKAAGSAESTALWIAAVPAALLTVAYGWLLYRGPFEREFGEARDARG